VNHIEKKNYIVLGYIEEMTLAADPLNAPARAAAPGSTALTMTAGIQQSPLKCKKCRRALVARDSVVTHTPGQGQASFGYRKRDATLHISEVKKLFFFGMD
jgi:dual specificity phosphatase 12